MEEDTAVVGGTSPESLLSAEMWEEARRVSPDQEVRRVGRIVRPYLRLVDLEERRENFEGTSDRYAVVLKIRAEAATYDPDAGVGGGEAEADDARSLFSLASNVSGASLRGDCSVGSASSVSSVISAGSISTFF